VFLTADLAPVSRLGSDLRQLGWRNRIRLVTEVLFPPRTYMQARYGSQAWLPWQYARRAALGAGQWLRTPARDV
jgi:hypothetical protein